MDGIEWYYWYPIEEVVRCVEDVCRVRGYKTILEIGPGGTPFSPATHRVGYNEKVDDCLEVDIDTTPLPFSDKSMDFMYSRHTFEDIQNPEFALREVFRVCRSGYIETPSPLIEVSKGVDAGPKASLYGGYIHHRYIIWSDIEKCEISLVPKYSSIIDHFFSDVNNEYHEMTKECLFWNQYFIWFDREPTIKMYKNCVNLGCDEHLVLDYCKLINEAIRCSIRSTLYFQKMFLRL